MRTFLAFAVDDPLRELWEVAIGTGMRRGELLGLRWDDIDLGRRALHVRRALSVVEGTVRLKRTKTNRGRNLHADEVVVAALGRHTATQAREAAAIPAWENGRNLVFTGPTGTPLDPMRINHASTRTVRQTPVPVIRLHDLRHLHASPHPRRGCQ